MQQSPSLSFIYSSSPSPSPSSSSSNLSLYDSGYSSPSFHFSSCPYSNESFYLSPNSCLPSYPIYQVSSTPIQSSNVSVVLSTTPSQSQQRRDQHLNTASPFFSSARKRISDQAIEHLNAFYTTNKRPTEIEKDRLAVECNITLAQVNTWFNNARSRRGDTRTKLSQKLLKKQIDSLSNQLVQLQQQQSSSF